MRKENLVAKILLNPCLTVVSYKLPQRDLYKGRDPTIDAGDKIQMAKGTKKREDLFSV